MTYAAPASVSNGNLTDNIDWEIFLMIQEPKTIPGWNKGLVVMLDAHSDLLSTGKLKLFKMGWTLDPLKFCLENIFLM